MCDCPFDLGQQLFQKTRVISHRNMFTDHISTVCDGFSTCSINAAFDCQWGVNTAIGNPLAVTWKASLMIQGTLISKDMLLTSGAMQDIIISSRLD